MMNEDSWLDAAYEDRNGGDVDTADDGYGIPVWECPGCGYEQDGPMWGPHGYCRDCYEDQIPSPYCEHGTYIGYPGGPDYICGMCEMGD